MKILVLGIGQSMRADDAAGLETVLLWQACYPQTAVQARVETTELPGVALLDSLAGMEAAILVDAVHSSAIAGTIIRLGQDELASFTPELTSSHGWGVAETLHLGFSLNPSLAECRITLIGIIGRNFELGAGLSYQVQAALPIAADMVENEIQAILN